MVFEMIRYYANLVCRWWQHSRNGISTITKHDLVLSLL